MARHFKLTEETPLERLIKQLKTGARQQQYEAVEELGRLTDSGAVPVLIEALKDRDSSLRWRAAQALARQGDLRAIEPLIEALHNEVPAVREEVIRALAALRARRSIPALRELVHDPDLNVSRAATEALEQFGVRAARQRPPRRRDQPAPSRGRPAQNDLTTLLSALALLAFLAALVGNLMMGTHFDLLWVGGLALIWVLGAWLLGYGLNSLMGRVPGGSVMAAVTGFIVVLFGLAILGLVAFVVAKLRLYVWQ